jgi:uncharacterized membrane protein
MKAFPAALLVGAVACDSAATRPDAAPGIGGNEAGPEGGDDAAAEGGDDAAAEGGEEAGGADARATDSAVSCDAPNGNARGQFFLMDPLSVHDPRPGDDSTRTSRTTTIVGASADGSTIIGVSRFHIAPIPGSETETGMAVFRWTQATGVVGLGSPSSLVLADPRKGGCDGVTMSSDASVVFGSCVSAAGLIHYRWTAGTGFELLPIASSQLSMRATTRDGTVLVGDGCCTSLDSFSAFRWSTLSGLTTIHPVPGMAQNTVASVTPAGDVIFGYSSDFQHTSAFRWAADTGIVTFPRLPGADRCDVIRTAPPRDGSSIVGNCRQQGGFEAYRWTTSAGTVALGAPAGYTSTYAQGVSRDGSIVAGTTGGAGDPAAFRWTAATGSVVIAVAKNVTHMSDDGSVIVGNSALSPGDERAFRWTAAGTVDLLPLPSDSHSMVKWLSSDGATMVGISYDLMTPQRPSRAVTWDADGNAHSIADLLQAAGVDLRGTSLTEVSYGDGHLFWGHAIIPSGERRAWVARLLDRTSCPAPDYGAAFSAIRNETRTASCAETYRSGQRPRWSVNVTFGSSSCSPQLAGQSVTVMTPGTRSTTNPASSSPHGPGITS